MNNSNGNTLINQEARIFYLGDYVNNASISKLCFNLLGLIHEDDEKEAKEVGFTRQPIKIYIQSYGGCVDDMWTLVDIMLSSKTPIHTYCTGYAMSAGLFIFVAGHKRFATKHSKFMYHQMSYGMEGTQQEFEEIADYKKYVQSILELYIVERTKIKQSQLKENRVKKQDWFIFAQEALELGIVTDII